MTRKEKAAEIKRTVEEALNWPVGTHADALVEFVLKEREAAGQKWDPEEKPFPERLKMSQFGDLQYEDGPIMLTIRDKREVVRRWNAFPRLWRLADAPNEFVPVISARSLQDFLLAILDGKETP